MRGHGLRRLTVAVGYATALAMALVGFENSTPSFWIIPRIGPFPTDPLRRVRLLALPRRHPAIEDGLFFFTPFHIWTALAG